MKKVLFTTYKKGFPNETEGGCNNIIYKIIKNNTFSNIELGYLSNDIFFEKIDKNLIEKINNNLPVKKKIAYSLFEKYNLYRKVFTSDFYLRFHFFKNSKYYSLSNKKIKKYNIIHSQDSVSLGLIANENLISKNIMTVHSKGPLSNEILDNVQNQKLKKKIDRRLKLVELKSIKFSDYITFPSNAGREYFEDSLNIKLKEEKVKIIYNGIDFNRITNIYEKKILNKYSILCNSEQLILVNIAAHNKEKNIDILLKVVNRIKYFEKKDVFLINIGSDGKITTNLKLLVNELKIEGNVIFLNKIPNDDVIRFIKIADIFIMTSEKVIFDLVLLEALAAGACCVVSNEGGNKEIIEDGVNGYMIDIDDVNEIARKIISIKTKIVKRNAIKTSKQFTLKKMVDEYFKIYQELLNGV